MKFFMKKIISIFVFFVCLFGSIILFGQSPKPTPAPEENLEYSITSTSGIYALAASPDGTTLAYSKKSSIILVDFETGKQKKEIDMKELIRASKIKNLVKIVGYIRSMDFHPDGKKIAVGFIGGLVLVDISTNSILWYCNGSHTLGMPDSTYAVYKVRCNSSLVFSSTIDDNSVYIWNIKDGTLNRKITTPFKEIYSFDISYNEKEGKIIVSGKGGLELYKFSGERIWQLDRFANTGPVNIHPNDSVVAVACTGPGSRVILLNLYDTKKKKDLGPAADRSLGGVCWSRNKKSVYCCAIGMGTAPVLQYSLVKDEVVKTVISKDFDSDPDCDRGCVVDGTGFLLAVAGKNKILNVYKIER